MFMRYLGGGVGHYKVHVPDAEEDEPDVPDEVLHPLEASAGDEDKSDGEDSDVSGEEEDEGEPESKEANEETMLGPEDGEDMMEDLTDDLGYAAL
jgi:hypothetical protein